MSTMTETGVTQVYRVYIKATPEAIWDAITKPEWTSRYGYPGRAEYDLRPGGSYRVTANEREQAMGMPELLVEGVRCAGRSRHLPERALNKGGPGH